MKRGLDSDTPLGPHAACLAQAGYTFACRYIKRTASALTHAEAKALSAAGLYVVSIVEIGSPTSAGYFSYARGLEDADFAYAYARDHLIQPAGSVIYFAVDYDAALADLKGPIAAYFKGVLQAFDSASGGHPEYHIGVYGSGLTCSKVFMNTAVTHTWLSMSTGWRGSRTFLGWNLKQTVGGTACGVSIDEDESRGAGGGWKV
jgi:Domain of unknown function (DUF1906)